MQNEELLKADGNILGSRGEVRKAAMWGATEAEREIANALLKLMPTPNPNKSVEWADSPWNPKNAPSLEEMTNSLIGQQTLAMFAECPEVGEGADDPKLDASSPESPATDPQVTNSSPPTIQHTSR